MDITIYDVIKGPVVTDKAYRVNKTLNQLIIRVHVSANKVLVKEAVEKLFDVKVDKVRISIRKPKRRMVGRRVVMGSTQKKAIVTLKSGHSLDVLSSAPDAFTNVHAKEQG